VLAANVDLVLIVVPVDFGLNSRLLERLSIIARESGARPLVIVTKVDRASDPTSLKAQIESDDADVEVVLTSSVTGEGIETLRSYLPPGVTAVMLGASGAGKTSLLNALEGTDELTKNVGRDGEGRHATTTRKLYRLSSGGVLLDIPGIRLLEVMVDEEGIRLMFEDIEELALQCRFRNCHHRGDVGCAVELAVASGALSARRLETWREMQSEIENHERLRDPATARAQRKPSRMPPKGS
jgi:ribosome biogenesis GTPase